jgi:FeS assembly SUF system protein
MEIDTSRLHPQPQPESPPALEPPKVLAVPLTETGIEELRRAIVNELHQCFDPEIPVNIYELGLIYGIAIQPSGSVQLRMTLTSPACPVAGSLPGEVKSRLAKLPNVTSATIDLVWEPPWDKNLMSEAAKLQLGIDD